MENIEPTPAVMSYTPLLRILESLVVVERDLELRAHGTCT